MNLDDNSNQETTKRWMGDHEDGSENAPPPIEKYRLWFSKRFVILILIFFGYFFRICIKTSINVSLVEMTAGGTIHVGNKTIFKPADVDWDSKTIGKVVECYNYLYIFAIVGGYLATKYGGSVTYGVTVAVESILTIHNPLCLKWGGLYGFLACRILVGFFDGLAYASTAEIYSRWVPFSERFRFISIIFCGVYIANTFSIPIFGYIAQYYGWRMIFYFSGRLGWAPGSCGLVWSIVWLIVARNEPSEDRFISKKERKYILNTAETAPRDKIVHPYGKIIFSPATWAMCLAKISYYCGSSIVLIFVTFYIRDMAYAEFADIKTIGLISSISNISRVLFTPLIGAIIDYSQNNTSLTPNKVHKILMTFGFVSSSVLFVVLAFSTNFILSMVCFALINLFLIFNFLISEAICLYMAPKHASVLLGLSAFGLVINQFIIPGVFTFIVVNHTLREWGICFLLSAGVLMLGAIMYLFHGSSKLQPWAN